MIYASTTWYNNVTNNKPIFCKAKRNGRRERKKKWESRFSPSRFITHIFQHIARRWSVGPVGRESAFLSSAGCPAMEKERKKKKRKKRIGALILQSRDCLSLIYPHRIRPSWAKIASSSTSLSILSNVDIVTLRLFVHHSPSSAECKYDDFVIRSRETTRLHGHGHTGFSLSPN